MSLHILYEMLVNPVEFSENNRHHLEKVDTAPSDTTDGHARYCFLKSWYDLIIQEPGIPIKKFHSYCRKGAII